MNVGDAPHRGISEVNLNDAITSVPGQSIELSGLLGDLNSDGLVNAVDRGLVVGGWTSPAGFSCESGSLPAHKKSQEGNA